MWHQLNCVTAREHDPARSRAEMANYAVILPQSRDDRKATEGA